MRRIETALLFAALFALGCSPVRTTGGNGNNNNGNHNNDGNGSPDGGTDPNCGAQSFTLQHGTPPDLLIVQDRSGSMSQDPSGARTNNPAQSKWGQITAAIIQTVQSLQGSIEWGLEMFPDASQSGGFGGGASCAIASSLDVPVGLNNATAITNALNGAMPGGETPTAAAVNAAANFITAAIDNDGHPKYLLLATDGQPNCGSGGTGGMNDDSPAAEAAIAAAASSGIKTFVVGIGTDATEDATLTAMANNGGVPNTTPGAKAYYEVTSTNDLVTVINQIAGQIISCSFALQMAPPDPSLVVIKTDGNTLPRDTSHMNGWDFGADGMSIDFYGAACMALQSGVTQTVDAIYECPIG